MSVTVAGPEGATSFYGQDGQFRSLVQGQAAMPENIAAPLFAAGFRHAASFAHSGVAKLVGGSVVVSHIAVAAGSAIFLCAQSLSGVATPQALAVTARTNGASFTITSASASDTSNVAWGFN